MTDKERIAECTKRARELVKYGGMDIFPNPGDAVTIIAREIEQLQKENSKLHNQIRAFELDIYGAESQKVIDVLRKENSELKGKIERAIEMLESYMAKFGDCGNIYDRAKQTLSELKGEK